MKNELMDRLKSWLKRVSPKQGAIRGDEGFTLIEMAIALAILGILVAIAVPSYLNVRNRAYDAESKQILGEIRALTWSQFLEQDAFPADIVELGYTDGADTDKVYETTRWDYTVKPDVTLKASVDICAAGLTGPTSGRGWKLHLLADGTGTLDGPNASCP